MYFALIEETSSQRLQEASCNAKQVIVLQVQLDKIKRIIDRGFLWTFIAGVIGVSGYCVLFVLAALGFLNGASILPSLIGTTVFCGCVSFCRWYIQRAKVEYKKLLEQLQQTHRILK